jgi:hypothetical protein
MSHLAATSQRPRRRPAIEPEIQKIWISKISPNFYLVEMWNIKRLRPKKLGIRLFQKSAAIASAKRRSP